MKLFSKIQKIEQLPSRLKSLYLNRIIRDVGCGLISLFGVIFLYELGRSIQYVLLIYLAVGILYALLLPLFAKLLKFFSMHVFLVIGTVFSACYLLGFYLLSQAQNSILGATIFLIAFCVLYRLFYWIPYHVDFARFVDKHHRGRRLSYLSILVSVIGIALPIFSAFMINKFGFPVLFFFALIIVLLSALPALFVPRTRERYSFGYWESFQKLFSKKHFKSNLAYFADGFQSGIGWIIWPIFIFLLLDGKYMSVGLVSATIVLATCILRYITGEITDKFDKKKLIKTGSILYAAGWVLKAITATAFHVFLFGAFHDFVKVIMRTPFDALMYEIAADQGHYVDEFSVLREMSLHIGRAFMLVIALIMIGYLSLPWIFVLGALVSLLLNLVTKEEFVY